MGYAIRDWDRNFETAESRKLKRLPWVRIPVKLDGWGYANLIDHKDGPAHFGCWLALVELAALCRPRGALNRPTGEPMTLHDISRQTRIPMALMEAAITRLSSMGWVESPENLPLAPDVPGDCRGNPPDTVRDVTVRDGTGVGASPPAPPPPRKRGAERKEGDPRINSLKAAWLALYATATGEQPAFFNHGAWGRMCKVALKAHDEPALLARANAFFGHERARLSGYRFEAFFRDLATYNGRHAKARPQNIAAIDSWLGRTDDADR